MSDDTLEVPSTDLGENGLNTEEEELSLPKLKMTFSVDGLPKEENGEVPLSTGANLPTGANEGNKDWEVFGGNEETCWLSILNEFPKRTLGVSVSMAVKDFVLEVTF